MKYTLDSGTEVEVKPLHNHDPQGLPILTISEAGMYPLLGPVNKVLYLDGQAVAILSMPASMMIGVFEDFAGKVGL